MESFFNIFLFLVFFDIKHKHNVIIRNPYSQRLIKLFTTFREIDVLDVLLNVKKNVI